MQERTIEVPGFSLAVKIWHSQAAKPVLCLHGKLDNAASFDLLAPLLKKFQLVSVDYPGTGLSSRYPAGLIPYWKNDAVLMLHLIKTLGWQRFDIIAHSLGSLLATALAIARPQQVRKLVFLDILGPTVKFIEQGVSNLRTDMENYLKLDAESKNIFPDQESAIRKRMQFGNVSYQAARALALRGTKKNKDGWFWSFDPRLQYVNSTIPYEDETIAMFKAIQAPVCLIRAKRGVTYPEAIFQERAQAIKNLIIHEVTGGHHVHMDDPIPVAKIIEKFLG